MAHPDNLMSVAAIRGTVADHVAHLDRLTLVTATDPDPELVSRRKLAEIRALLAKANADFAARRYQRALRRYKRLQGLVYALIRPSFDPDLVFTPGLRLPMTEAVFIPLLASSLDLLDKIAPSRAAQSFGSATISLPAEVTEPVKAFEGLGVSIETGIPAEVREAALVGADHMAAGQWSKAAAFFKLGLEALGAGREDAAARAAMQLNLGAALLQAGEAEAAAEQLKAADAQFKAAGDTLGQSQVQTNRAAMLAKQGKGEEAGKALASADKLLLGAGAKLPVITLGDAEVTPTRPQGPGGLTRPTIDPGVVLRPNRPLRPVPDGAETIGAATTRVLKSATDAAGAAVVLRMPAAEDGWIVQELETVAENAAAPKAKKLSAQFGATRLDLAWKTDAAIDTRPVIAKLYEARRNSLDLGMVNFAYELDADFSLRLPHLYHYSLPVKIGDCYRELGDFDMALASYRDAAGYSYINRMIEMPALWFRIADTIREKADRAYMQGDPVRAVESYDDLMTLEEDVPAGAWLFAGPLKPYGDKVAAAMADLDALAESGLNPRVAALIAHVRTRLKMIRAGLDYWGIPANYFPIFKFDYLQGVATHFAQRAVQAEREYITFTQRGEDEELTRQQIEQSIESADAEVRLAEEQIDYARAEEDVTRENLELAQMRRANAIAQRAQFAATAADQAQLDAAIQFAGGPEGYEVSYSYYSAGTGQKVTLSGSDAYKVMSEAAYKRGMLARELELANMDRQIAELGQNIDLARAQQEAAEARVEVARAQRDVAELNRRHAEDLLDAFEEQTFTPEVWFQLGTHLRWIASSYMARALAVARKMQLAYELETGFRLSAIKDSYTTGIVSNLLAADYLLKDIEYFTLHRVMQSKAKDAPIKQEFSLAALNPSAFATTFKRTGLIDFDLAIEDFDRAYPGAFLRRIKAVEVIVEGLLPPGGVHGTLRNTGISRDRRKSGEVFYRLQPRETMWLSQHDPRADISIFQPDGRTLGVFEHCGVASGWTLEIPPHANDVDYETISDIRMIVHYTAQHDPLLETRVRGELPKSGAAAMVIPFRLVFPDAYYAFVDTGEMRFDLRATDFPFSHAAMKVKDAAFRVVLTEGSPEGIRLAMTVDGRMAEDDTDAGGAVRSGGGPLDALRGAPAQGEWSVSAAEAANPGFDRTRIRDLFLFLEYDFDYRGM